MNYGLIFTKHTKPSATEQRKKITMFTSGQKMPVDKFIQFDENPDLSVFKPNDTIICYAWDCLCSDRAFLRKFLQYVLTKGLFLYSTLSEYHIDNTMDLNAMKYAFDMYMDIRFNFISSKNIAGAKQRVKNGHAPGRPRGARGVRHIMDGKGDKASKMYKNGSSMYAIARELGVSAPTIKRFLTAHNQRIANA